MYFLIGLVGFGLGFFIGRRHGIRSLVFRPFTKCRAKQMSDQMVCLCGNRWDVNDQDRPVCRPFVVEE